MTMILKNIKEYVAQWKDEIRTSIQGKNIRFAIFQVGDNEASNRYVRNKIKDCVEVGIIPTLLKFDDEISQDIFIEKIKMVAPQVSGLMVQLPLPPHIDVAAVTESIPADKDVDGFTTNSKFKPCTPFGIIKYLEYCGFEFDGANAVVIGRSDIVGKPMAKMLTDKNATVSLCHSHTKDLHSRYIRGADLIICAVGKAGFLNCYSIYAPVIDVGINFTDEGKLVGDCINTENRDVTPVPGGVGLLTRAALLDNLAHTEPIDGNEQLSLFEDSL